MLLFLIAYGLDVNFGFLHLQLAHYKNTTENSYPRPYLCTAV